MTYKLHPGSLYDYNAGTYCGVLVEEAVMKKLAKAQAKHLEEVKRILYDNIEQVYPSMWTLHYPEGKQTNVDFIDTSADVKERIKMATTSNPPRHKPVVFVAESMKEAERMADERFEEVGE